MTVHGRVIRVIDRGAIVLVDGEIEGFVPATQLGIESFHHPGEHFATEDELDLKVTRIDLANHRMVLSVKAWLGEQDARHAERLHREVQPEAGDRHRDDRRSRGRCPDWRTSRTSRPVE